MPLTNPKAAFQIVPTAPHKPKSCFSNCANCPLQTQRLPFESCQLCLTNQKLPVNAALQDGQDVDQPSVSLHPSYAAANSAFQILPTVPFQPQKLPFDAALQDGQDADPHGVQQRLRSGVQHAAGSQPHLGHHHRPLLFLSAHLCGAGADCVLHSSELYGILAAAACQYVHR